MRQLGTIPDQKTAQRFADFLLTKGILLSIDPAPGGWAVWVRNEDHLDEARREFAQFSAAPDAPTYRDAAQTAESLRAQEQRRAAEAKKNLVNVGKSWRRGGASGVPVTAILMAASIAISLWTNFGQNQDITDHLKIDTIVPTLHGWQLERIWMQQPWRLVTPIFLHFGPMHIVFNMLMLWQLGGPIERVIGSFRYVLLILVIAIPSNFAQYHWGDSGPGFGGMSGVVYGLFGYIWMKSRYEPQSGFMITRDSVIWMVGWFFLCLTGWVGPIANIVHGVGLAVGIVVGRFPSLWRLMR